MGIVLFLGEKDNSGVEYVPGILHQEELGLFHVAGIVSNDADLYGKEFSGRQIVYPGLLRTIQYDAVVILRDLEKMGSSEIAILDECMIGYGVPRERLVDKWTLLRQIVMAKYQYNDDEEIRSVLDFWKQGGATTVYNHFIQLPQQICHLVSWDETCSLPYIEFQTATGTKRRMYYPRGHEFEHISDRPVVRNLMMEQLPGSPHIYQREVHSVRPSDVIADVGVCEGNFALSYVDIASKIYLFECDPNWIEPLEHTFAPDGNKVVFIKKAASQVTGNKTVCLDDVIEEPLDFLKMDVEGVEASVLMGAENLLCHSHTRVSVCSYHRHGDEVRIRRILESYGYQTDVSSGYMLFLWEPDVFWHAEFRRGMVYGDKV